MSGGRPVAVAQCTRVLVVDDHELFRRGLLMVLADEGGIEVIGECGDLAAAVELAARLQPDLVLVDARVFGGNVDDGCRGLVTAAPSARTLLLAADGLPLDEAAVLAAGAAGVLRQGTSIAEVTAAIRSAVAPASEGGFAPTIVPAD